MPCASVLRRIQLFELLIQLMKGSGLLIASTVLQPILLGFVDLFLVLAFLLLILLNLKPIFYILLHSPSIFNSFSDCFGLYELVAFEVFEDGQEVAFEDFSEAVFFLDGKEGKQVVDGWKGMFVVIVANYDLSDHIFLSGLGSRCYQLLLFRRYRLYLWLYLFCFFFALYHIFYLLHNILLYFYFHNHILRILFFLSKSPILSSRLFHFLLDVRLLREWLRLQEHRDIASTILLIVTGHPHPLSIHCKIQHLFSRRSKPIQLFIHQTIPSFSLLFSTNNPHKVISIFPFPTMLLSLAIFFS